MDCAEVTKLLDAYADGELDLVHSLEVERHLAGCPDCQQRYENQQTLKKALQTSSLYFEPPAGLQKRLHKSLLDISRDQPFPRRRLELRWRVALAMTAVLLVVSAGMLGWLVFNNTTTQDQLADQVTASHVRSLMVGHLADVASTDQHTVKPWFNGKLDFSPPVQDLTEKGFPLIGGRLDYLDKRTVAALIYQRREHKINLFIWPASSAENTSPQAETRQGYNLFHWTKNNMNFWAVSDLNSSELGQFVEQIRMVT